MIRPILERFDLWIYIISGSVGGSELVCCAKGTKLHARLLGVL